MEERPRDKPTLKNDEPADMKQRQRPRRALPEDEPDQRGQPEEEKEPLGSVGKERRSAGVGLKREREDFHR
jgi:hypothetical protein